MIESRIQLLPAALRDFALRYTDAWCSREPAKVAAFFAPGGSLAVNDAPPAVGRSAIIRDVVRVFMEAFPDLLLAMKDLRIEGGIIEYHWTLTGSNTGPGGTGRRVCISGFEEWTIGADGLIAESRGHFDRVEYQRQLDQGV